MSTLQLAVKGIYFDAIKARVKTQEFRLRTPYWTKRLVGRDYEQLVITKGYPERSDESRRLVFGYHGYELQTITHPHFGAAPVEVFAINVGATP